MFTVIISFILVVIGALNWLCVGFFQYDLVAGIFGTQSNIFSRIIYIVIGLASIWLTYAVIRYRATLHPLAKKVDGNMEKIHSKTANAHAESSEELYDNHSHTNRLENNNKNSQKYEASKYNDFSDHYTSYGYDYKNSRRNSHDYYDEDEDDDE